MAIETITVDNGAEPDYEVAVDTGTEGAAQLFKLAYSADGDLTLVPVDANGLLVNLGANNDVTVAGVSTAANQSTIIGHLDGVETLLGTIDAGTGTIATEVAGLLTDTELRATPLDVDTELPAAVELADDLPNPTAPAVGSYLLGWDPAAADGAGSWRRVPANEDGMLVRFTGSGLEIFGQVTPPNNSVVGTIAADEETVAVTNAYDAIIQCVDTAFDGTLVLEISLDGTNWVAVDDSLITDVATGLAAPVSQSGLFVLNFAGRITNLRVRCNTYVSGSVDVTIAANGVG